MTQSEDLLADFGLDGEFLGELTAQGTFQVFSVAHFAPRELPLQAVGIGAVALANQDSVTVHDDAGGNQDGCRVGHNIIVAGKCGRRGGAGGEPSRGLRAQWMCLTFFCM